MATVSDRKVKKNKQGRRVVIGIEHGLSGYTNYGCKCDTCTDANTEHSREYRNRRFAGSPLCRVPKCRRVQSRSYGNSLCYRHAQATNVLRGILQDMSRQRLKAYIRQEELEVKVYKRMTDDEIRELIIDEIITLYPGSLRSYVEDID